MELITNRIDEEACFVLPIGDLHIGDRAFAKEGKRKLLSNLEWACNEAKHPVRIILMGDIFNIAGRSSKTNPFESNPNEVFEAEELFEPVASLIDGAIRGNHENRVVNEFGYDPLQLLCRHLGIRYMGTSGIYRYQVGKRPDSESYWQTYHLAVHHSTGGGGSAGNALNQAVKLESIYTGCDGYLIGHNHQLFNNVQERYYPSASGIKARKVHYIGCGSYLAYPDSYAEGGMMKPGKMGSPRLRLDGRRERHDLHVSL